MRSLKKYVLFVLLAVFVASLTLTPARAQSGLSANVPFDFVVGKTTMKAGSYRIGTQGAFVSFTSIGGRTRFALLSPGRSATGRSEPYLVFTRYGTESFLSKIVFSARNTYDLPRSGRESELAARGASGEQVAVLIAPVR